MFQATFGKRLRLEKYLRQARQDFPTFFRFVFGLRVQPFQEEWLRHVEEHPLALIIAPQEHGKSTMMALAYPLFLVGRNPELIIKLISHSDRKAVDRLLAISHVLSGESPVSERLHLVFPHLKPSVKGVWNQHQLALEGSWQHPSFEAFSIMSAASGSRAHIIIFDDPVDYKNAIALPPLRRRVIDIFNQVFLNFLFPEGRIIYICTVWHKEDLTSKLEKNPEFAVLKQAVGPNLEPLWPEVWSKEKLEEKRRSLEPSAFNRAFRNVPLESEEAGPAAFDLLWLEETEEGLEEPRVFFGVDPHPNKAAIFILESKPDRYHVRDVIRGRFTGPLTLEKILELAKLHKPVAIGIEANAYQSVLVQFLQQHQEARQLSLQPLYTGKQKEHPEEGLPAIATEMRAGKWSMPKLGYHSACQCGVCTWRSELSAYPFGDEDDTVMAMWLAWRTARIFKAEPKVGSIKLPRSFGPISFS